MPMVLLRLRLQMALSPSLIRRWISKEACLGRWCHALFKFRSRSCMDRRTNWTRSFEWRLGLLRKRRAVEQRIIWRQTI